MNTIHYEGKAASTVSMKCGKHLKAQTLAQLIRSHPKQQRKSLRCSAKLSKLALMKAKEMAKRKKISHILPIGPNQSLRDHGYPLADIYTGVSDNQVEAIAGGISDPKEMMKGFLDSSAHRIHLLAQDKFYQLQDELGVGYHYDASTPHIHYWVVYIAHQNKDQDRHTKVPESKPN